TVSADLLALLRRVAEPPLWNESFQAILVVSDGSGKFTRSIQAEVTDVLTVNRVPVYGISIASPDALPAAVSSDEFSITTLLDELTVQTGGLHLTVNDVAAVPAAAWRILVGLKNRYVIGYKPRNTARDGGYRKLRFDLVPPRGLPQLFVRYPAGYFAAK
ncbi:MAG: hypothetical protein HY646_19255, partial [Acidobacteria bacterium]|nr:hypothetical protein [Acidobacteriota bacterium]